MKQNVADDVPDKHPTIDQGSLPEEGELQIQLKATQDELQTYQKYLQDWHNWGEAKTQELNSLQQEYEECQKTYQTQSNEVTNLQESNNQLMEENNKLKQEAHEENQTKSDVEEEKLKE